jgi:hypothetical protein
VVMVAGVVLGVAMVAAAATTAITATTATTITTDLFQGVGRGRHQLAVKGGADFQGDRLSRQFGFLT